MNTWHLRLAVEALRAGGIVAYPTEGVFGLGCDPDNDHALLRLRELKRRPASEGLILIAADLEQLRPYVEQLDSTRMRAIKATWPGPVTWLMPAGEETSALISGRHPTVAVRVTAHPIAAALCRAYGTALVSTSANARGRPPPRTALRVRLSLGSAVDYIVNGSVGGGAGPTEIRDGATGAVIRAAASAVHARSTRARTRHE